MIQVNRIYLIFNRLVTKKFLVDTSEPICFLIFLSFFGLAKEDADMLDVRVKAVMFCSNG